MTGWGGCPNPRFPNKPALRCLPFREVQRGIVQRVERQYQPQPVESLQPSYGVAGFLGPKGHGYSGSFSGSLNFVYCILPSTGHNCRISRPSPSGIMVWL